MYFAAGQCFLTTTGGATTQPDHVALDALNYNLHRHLYLLIFVPGRATVLGDIWLRSTLCGKCLIPDFHHQSALWWQRQELILWLVAKSMYDKLCHSAFSDEIEMWWYHPIANNVRIKWQFNIFYTRLAYRFTNSLDTSFQYTMNNIVFLVNIRR